MLGLVAASPQNRVPTASIQNCPKAATIQYHDGRDDGISYQHMNSQHQCVWSRKAVQCKGAMTRGKQKQKPPTPYGVWRVNTTTHHNSRPATAQSRLYNLQGISSRDARVKAPLLHSFHVEGKEVHQKSDKHEVT